MSISQLPGAPRSAQAWGSTTFPLSSEVVVGRCQVLPSKGSPTHTHTLQPHVSPGVSQSSFTFVPTRLPPHPRQHNGHFILRLTCCRRVRNLCGMRKDGAETRFATKYQMSDNRRTLETQSSHSPWGKPLQAACHLPKETPTHTPTTQHCARGDSTAGRPLSLHTADPNLISGIRMPPIPKHSQV